MRRLFILLREHLHFFVVVTLLTLVMTFPTIIYVFRTDVFWHPAGSSHDIFIKFWDIWYGGQILSGQADRFHTSLIFYPEGVSLVLHPFQLPYVAMVSALLVFMPLPNAISFAYILIIFMSASAAYVYLYWLIKDKWIALLGAVVFGFSQHVFGHRSWPDIALIATIPLVMYCFHRGVQERRTGLIVCAGLLTGLTSTISLYQYVCVLMMLAFFMGVFALSRWRESVFWRHLGLLVAAVALASTWQLVPMLQSPAELGEALEYYVAAEQQHDVVDFLVNPRNPFLDTLIYGLLQIPESAMSGKFVYLGLLPLLLIGFGLFKRESRMTMLPWLMLCLVFLILSLGSTLIINGTEYEKVLLPKHYLNDLLPFVFSAFTRTDHFMAGARLPLAALSCFGLVALRSRFPVAAQPRFVVALIILLACEYYVPVKDDRVFPNRIVTEERLAFVDWLKQEEDQKIALINLPLERANSKIYLFYQSLHGYPQTEGAISRTPDSAYDYIRSNYVLNGWYNQREVTCGDENRISYLTALDRLEDDGFSHVVFYRDFYFWKEISDSFRAARPSYRDDYVSIYRMSDLRESCQ